MLTGIAIVYSEMPLLFIEQHKLNARACERGGEKEVQFLFRQYPPVLPVWHEGQLLLCSWGNRRQESRDLPFTGWTRVETIESGLWQHAQAQEVLIPASLGFDSGVWFLIRQGVRGLLVEDESGKSRVFVVCEPASHYYEVMTRSQWMPCLMEQRI